MVFVLPIKDQVLGNFGDEELDEDTLESVAVGKSTYALAPSGKISNSLYMSVDIPKSTFNN